MYSNDETHVTEAESTPADAESIPASEGQGRAVSSTPAMLRRLTDVRYWLAAATAWVAICGGAALVGLDLSIAQFCLGIGLALMLSAGAVTYYWSQRSVPETESADRFNDTSGWWLRHRLLIGWSLILGGFVLTVGVGWLGLLLVVLGVAYMFVVQPGTMAEIRDFASKPHKWVIAGVAILAMTGWRYWLEVYQLSDFEIYYMSAPMEDGKTAHLVVKYTGDAPLKDVKYSTTIWPANGAELKQEGRVDFWESDSVIFVGLNVEDVDRIDFDGRAFVEKLPVGLTASVAQPQLSDHGRIRALLSAIQQAKDANEEVRP